MNNTLVFWRNNPMDVNLGVFNYILDNWEGKIIVVTQNGYSNERKICGWSNEENSKYELYILSEMSNGIEFAEKLINENKDAIHIFAGIRGHNEARIRKLKQIVNNPKIIIIAERPAVYSKGIKGTFATILRNILYRIVALKYKNVISAFLVMGETGISQYISYGFNSDTMFQYMYCPLKSESCNNSFGVNGIVRFVYIGRFDRKDKGIDTLIDAVEMLPENEKWALDLVGGYGEYAQQTIEWSKNKKNVNYIGRWDFDDVPKKMSEYDVCIAPSKYDGWNLSPNHAINAGITTIVSNQATSDELIRYSGSGIVFDARSVTQLSEAMNKFINNREELEIFNKRACDYRKLISPDSVGKYFIEILHFVISDSIEKPKCPWRVEE